ncbi:efflux RND transporter periplasmic adaptor subunit [Chitinimonas arctica]|nr:efflux RND transporter periplasmic adaptor subunit [Chitinimonas arctica]
MPALLARFKRRPLLIGAATVLVVGGIIASQSGRAAPDASKAAKPPVVLELASSDVVRVADASLIRPLALSGSLNPVRQTAINAEVEGVVAAVLVRPGEVVKAGQVLARFETSDLNQLLATRQANQARARAEMQLAQKNSERNADLLKQGFISPNSYDQSESSLAVAVAQFKAEEAQTALARKALGDSAVRAPFGGIVSDRKVEPGSRVNMTQHLFSVVDLDEMEFEAAVPVNALAAVKVGQHMTLTVEGYPGKQLGGRVERIAPVADSASRMVPIYVRLQNPDGLLKGGQFVQGELALARADHAATLPFGAIRGLHGPAPHVMAVENGKAVSRPVRLGLLNELSKQVVVESGVPVGALVIIAKVENIKAGQAVKLPPAKS